MTYGKYNPDQYTPAPPADERYGTGLPPLPATRTPPPTNGGWAAAALVFFWPLAFTAFNRSMSVPMLWMQGRDAEAWAASESAARLGKISIVVSLVLAVLFVIIYVVIIAVAVSAVTPSGTYSLPR